MVMKYTLYHGQYICTITKVSDEMELLWPLEKRKVLIQNFQDLVGKRLKASSLLGVNYGNLVLEYCCCFEISHGHQAVF